MTFVLFIYVCFFRAAGSVGLKTLALPAVLVAWCHSHVTLKNKKLLHRGRTLRSKMVKKRVSLPILLAMKTNCLLDWNPATRRWRSPAPLFLFTPSVVIPLRLFLVLQTCWSHTSELKPGVWSCSPGVFSLDGPAGATKCSNFSTPATLLWHRRMKADTVTGILSSPEDVRDWRLLWF